MISVLKYWLYQYGDFSISEDAKSLYKHLLTGENLNLYYGKIIYNSFEFWGKAFTWEKYYSFKREGGDIVSVIKELDAYNYIRITFDSQKGLKELSIEYVIYAKTK